MPDSHVILVGCGRWGTNILRDLVHLGVNVTVVSPSLGNKTDILGHGARRVVANLNEVDKADGIIVATPTFTHAEVLNEVVHFGVPVFCEKPLTCSLHEAQKLVNIAPHLIFVMDKWRYHPGVIELRNLIESGQLGRARSISCTREQWGSPHSDVDASWILLPHDMSIALELFGSVPTPTSSIATVAHDELKQMSTHWKFVDLRTMSTTIGIARETPLRRISVIFDEGTATLQDGWSEHIEIRRFSQANSEAAEKIATSGPLPLVAELKTFLEYLKGGPPPKSSAHEGLAIVRAVHEARTMAALT